jgi:hypothetical protein
MKKGGGVAKWLSRENRKLWRMAKAANENERRKWL